MSENNGEWRVSQAEFNGFVKAKLEGIAKEQTGTNKELQYLNKEIIKNGKAIVGLKIKSGIWGALGGLLPVCIVLGYFIIREIAK
ncbi:hypothetical protein LCGC14_2798590 [marine sediment metagenome]|uniref:Uncharacterized protein n=1 Tax=marine sediment metagenome TaxID=412755 RepID=A0A0F8YNE1_9ZZZZ